MLFVKINDLAKLRVKIFETGTKKSLCLVLCRNKTKN